MRIARAAEVLGAAVSALAIGATVTLVRAADATPPPWAFGFLTPPSTNPSSGQPVGGDGRAPGASTQPEDTILRHLPGSDRAFTLIQLRDAFNVADWFPAEIG